MVLDYNILYDTVKRAVEAGVKIGLASTGAIKPFLNRSEAEKQYGKLNIKKWIEEGRLNPNRDGSASNWINHSKMTPLHHSKLTP